MTDTIKKLPYASTDAHLWWGHMLMFPVFERLTVGGLKVISSI